MYWNAALAVCIPAWPLIRPPGWLSIKQARVRALPVRIRHSDVWSLKAFEDRSAALKEEYRIKQLTRSDKLQLIAAWQREGCQGIEIS